MVISSALLSCDKDVKENRWFFFCSVKIIGEKIVEAGTRPFYTQKREIRLKMYQVKNCAR